MIHKINVNYAAFFAKCWQSESTYSWHVSIPYTWERMMFIAPTEATCWNDHDVKSQHKEW